MTASLTAVVGRARKLYAVGYTRAEVLAAVFGADLPREIFVIADELEADDETIGADLLPRMREVYRLVDPANEPYLRDTILQRCEETADARFPRTAMMLHLSTHSGPYGYVAGYRVADLHAGRTTVVGFNHLVPPEKAQLKVLGPSMLDVLEAGARRHLDVLLMPPQTWEEIRYGPDRDDDIADTRAALQRVEELRRKL